MDIEKLKRFKRLSILIWGILNVIFITIGIIGIAVGNYYLLYFYFLEIVFLIMFIFSFAITYKEFNIDGVKVFIYAGWEKHYLIVNGELVDEHITAFAFTPIELKYNDDNHNYYALISLSNSITFKLDGKLIK